LIRIVRTPEGLRVDPTGKTPGRGAYLHDQRHCWESGLKGALAHALKVELTGTDRETLRAFMATLPKEDALPTEGALPSEGALPDEGVPPDEGKRSAEEPLSVERPLSATERTFPQTGAQKNGKQASENRRKENQLGKAL
jgi:predicted RNA-binding protein YlxR (DUF448 family)